MNILDKRFFFGDLPA